MNNCMHHRLGPALMVVAVVGLVISTFAKQAGSAERSPGGSPGASAERTTETAQAVRNAMKLEVVAGCSAGNATFRVRNLGESWPKSSTFAIYRLGGNGRHLISKRRLRLKDGQKASFRVKRAKNPTGRLALWVDPSWYDRRFDFDATVTCR